MTKNVLVAIQDRLWIAPAVMILPAFVFWTPIYCAIAGAIEYNAALALVGTAGYLIPYLSMCTGRRLFPFKPLKASFYPLVVVPVFCCMALRFFLYLVRGEVAWRGRSIRVARWAARLSERMAFNEEIGNNVLANHSRAAIDAALDS